MTREELIAIQAPVKEKYLKHPNEVAITLSGSAYLGADVTNAITNGKQTIETGLHPGSGGSHSNIGPGRYF